MKVDAEAAGMDPGRLARIDDHLRSRYVEPGKIAGCQIAVMRRGSLAHFSNLGLADRERNIPVSEDTIWRIYSMTKPITGVALMSLYERGHFQLTDPVTRFIPQWADMKVADPTLDGSTRLVDAHRPISIRDLLMHMSGLGYGRDNSHLNLDASDGKVSPPSSRFESLAEMVDRQATWALRFQPGTRWLYSFGTDVCARLVEIISGRSFDRYLEQEVFGPLGMTDTRFYVADADAARFAAMYGRNSRKELVLIDDPDTSSYRTPPKFLSGGGGLVSTIGDYLRFCEMMLGGGELDGRRILGRKTIELMTINHLPGGGAMSEFALPGGYGEVGFEGMGFGLTMSVSKGPAATGIAGSAGEFMWGGAASTAFWVDPKEELLAVFMTQLLPSGTFNFRGQLKALVYQAIVD
ncbi:MAG TPA: serine hydrolase domain-containing protein [Acidimicrobiales bacterium]|nr:serine hydrolase domain-containing protein [Acidimicrobiales bacterium]